LGIDILHKTLRCIRTRLYHFSKTNAPKKNQVIIINQSSDYIAKSNLEYRCHILIRLIRVIELQFHYGWTHK